jgi:WD40 repeat protein
VLQGGKRVGRIALGSGGCHTLHYNRLTQSLIPLGYHSTVAVYTVEGAQFDVELRSVLRGHRSIITCVDSLAASALLVTGDDTGEVRIW